MALTEDIIFSDPVLQRIFFDGRRFAPRSDHAAGIVSGLEFRITEAKVRFLKAKTVADAEPLQIRMRRLWFVVRKYCDGYFIDMPCNYDDGCEHVQQFAHDSLDAVFSIDLRQRAALWYKHAQRAPTRIE